MAPHKLLALLLLLLVCLTSYVHGGAKKIKIHVPYYVKHIHHYKKVYIPKVQVVKHEHLHKKEHEHHHHHDHGHHHHDHYDKSDGQGREEYDTYFDNIGHRSYHDDTSNRLPRSRGKYRGDDYSEETSSQENSASVEDDYISDEDDGEEGTIPAPTIPSRYRTETNNRFRLNEKSNRYNRGPYRRVITRRFAIVPTQDSTTLYITPSASAVPRRVITKVLTST